MSVPQTSVIGAMEAPVDFNPETHQLNIVIDRTGDTKHIWDRRNEAEVDAARELFKKLKKDGYTAYNVKGKDGEKGSVMSDFDAQAERVIFSPRAVGG